jgi:glucokinase
MEQRVIGVDIGGTKIAAALVARDGRSADCQTIPTPAQEGPTAILNAIVGLVSHMRDQARTRGVEAAAIGVGTAGQVDIQRGVITYSVDILPRWAGTQIRAILAEQLRLPVAVDNDVNAMALGELRFGAARGLKHTLYAAVGTGIGGALTFDGHLWRGSNWTAGELGHTVAVWNSDRRCNCGATGHLEAYAAGPAMAAEYARRCRQTPSDDLRPVLAAAERGDSVAKAVLAEGAAVLGSVLGGLINVFDPEALIVGGGVAQPGELWWKPFEAAVRANPLPGPQRIAIHHAQLGAQATLIGAAALAWDMLI